jgi:hypothetical protein
MIYIFDIDTCVISKCVNTALIEELKALGLPGLKRLQKDGQKLEIECDSLNATQKTALDKAIKDHNPSGEIVITS